MRNMVLTEVEKPIDTSMMKQDVWYLLVVCSDGHPTNSTILGAKDYCGRLVIIEHDHIMIYDGDRMVEPDGLRWVKYTGEYTLGN